MAHDAVAMRGPPPVTCLRAYDLEVWLVSLPLLCWRPWEPPHVHVERDDNVAKFWLDPVRLQWSGGFRRAEIRRIQRLVERNGERLLRSWNDYFND